MKIKYFSLFILGMAIIWGCTNDDFKLSNQNAAQVGFYSRSTDVESDTTLSGIHVMGVGKDAYLAPYDSIRVKKLFLPLDFNGENDSDSTKFELSQVRIISDENDTITDILKFFHNKELVFISGETGLFYNMYIDSVHYTTNFIDTIRIEYPHVKYNENIENVKIYIKP